MVEFPPATPFTCQVTLVFTLPTTDARKVCDVPAGTIAVAGVTATVTVGNRLDPPPPPQATKRPNSTAVNIEAPGPFICVCTLVNGNTRRLDTLHQATASRPMPFIYTLHPCHFCCLVPLLRNGFHLTLILMEIGHCCLQAGNQNITGTQHHT